MLNHPTCTWDTFDSDGNGGMDTVLAMKDVDMETMTLHWGLSNVLLNFSTHTHLYRYSYLRMFCIWFNASLWFRPIIPIYLSIYPSMDIQSMMPISTISSRCSNPSYLAGYVKTTILVLCYTPFLSIFDHLTIVSWFWYVIKNVIKNVIKKRYKTL